MSTDNAKENQILMPTSQQFIIKECDGKLIRAQHEKIFPAGEGGPHLLRWGKYTATPKTPVQSYELIRDAAFKEVFNSFNIKLESLCLTQRQIQEFCKKNSIWLLDENYQTLFLFLDDKKKTAASNKLSVAYIVNHFGRLGFIKYDFDDKSIRPRGRLYRVIVPRINGTLELSFENNFFQVYNINNKDRKLTFEEMFRYLEVDFSKLWFSERRRDTIRINHPGVMNKNSFTYFLQKIDETKPATKDNLAIIVTESGFQCGWANLDCVEKDLSNNRYFKNPSPQLVVPRQIF